MKSRAATPDQAQLSELLFEQIGFNKASRRRSMPSSSWIETLVEARRSDHRIRQLPGPHQESAASGPQPAPARWYPSSRAVVTFHASPQTQGGGAVGFPGGRLSQPSHADHDQADLARTVRLCHRLLGRGRRASCNATATEKKLAGAAKGSFLKKCEKDAQASCEAQAGEKKLAGAAKNSFVKMRQGRGRLPNQRPG